MADYHTSIDIEAPPDVVFTHLTTPDGLTAWLGQFAQVEAVAGGAFLVHISGAVMTGRVLEVVPSRRFVVSWGLAGSGDFPPGSSRLSFTLTPTDRGTRLELVHTGIPETRGHTHAAGWQHFLPRLGAVAEGGDVRPDFWRPGPDAGDGRGRDEGAE